MDFIKISLWLFLAMSLVYKGDCKSFSKYLVPDTSRTSNAYGDNCFCFKNSGDYQKVPEILSQIDDNLERIIVYLYKDKSTSKVKMYVPNEEKQTLIPDLAFEVGDKLVTVEDEKVKDILSRVANIPIYHDLHKHPDVGTNKVLSTEIDIPPADMYVDGITYHGQPQVDTNRVPSNEINIPSNAMYVGDVIYNGLPLVDTNRLPSNEINIPSDVMYDGDVIYNGLPLVDTNRIPSNEINIPSDVMYDGDVIYNGLPLVDTNRVPPNEINIPADDMYVGDVIYNGLPLVDTNRVPSKGIYIPDDVTDVEDVTYHDRQIDTYRVPSKEINIPGDDIYVDGITYNGVPQIDTYRLPSKKITIPTDGMYYDDVTYHGRPQADTNRVRPNNINIPAEFIYVDGVNYYGQYKQPHADNEIQSQEINKPEFQYIAPINSFDHGQPQNTPAEVMYVDNVSPQLSIEKEYPSKSKDNAFVVNGQPGSDIMYEYMNILPEYYGQREKPHFDTNRILSKKINIPSKVMYVDSDNPRVPFEQGIPYLNGEYGLVVNGQPSADWNILPEYNIIDPHKHGNEHMYIHHTPHNYRTYHGQQHVSNDHSKPSASFQYSEEIEPSEPNEEISSIAEIDPNIVPSIESESDREMNSIVREDTSKIYDSSKESILSELNQLSENESSYNNQWREYSDPSSGIMFSHEIGEVKKGSKEDNTIPALNNHNQYKTFDIWFGQQMQRFRTYTEHDRAVNLAAIERYILKILHDNGMHVTAEGVLTDSYGTALDVRKLHLRPILIGNPLAFGRILNEKLTDFVLPANMAYLQAILVTNAHPSMILGIIPIGKTVIPPSDINAYSTLLKPHVQSSSKPTKGYHTHLSLSKPATHFVDNSGRINFKDTPGLAAKKPFVWQLAGERQMPVNVKKNVDHKKGKTVITVVKKTPIIVRHRHHQPAKSVQAYGTGGREFNLQADNSDEAVNNLIISMRSGTDTFLNSEEATNKLLAALGSGKTSLVSSSEESVDTDEEDISGRIIGGSAATGSGTPLSMKGRMKDF